MNYDGIKINDGLKIGDGIRFNDGIDFGEKHKKKLKPIAKRGKSEKTRKQRSPHRPIYFNSERIDKTPKEPKQRAKWTTTITLPNGFSTAESYAILSKKKDQRTLLWIKRQHGYSRRCTVKFRYTEGGKRPGGNRKLAAFAGVKKITTNKQYNTGMIGYIARKDATMDPESEQDLTREENPLFTIENGKTVRLDIKKAIGLFGGDDVFTIIISPEDKDYDEEKLVENFINNLKKHMHVLDKKTNTKIPCPDDFKWVAAVHHNTDHKHIHLLVKRNTEKGKLRINKQYIKNGARKDCEKILTAMCGERTYEEELAKALEKAATYRFTDIDKMILAMAGRSKHKGQLSKYSIDARDDHNAMLIQARLEWLRKSRLASYSKDTLIWTLNEKYEELLNKMEMANAFGLPSSKKDLEKYILDDNKVDYKGTILKTVRPNEDSSRIFMLIEDEEKKKHLRKEHLNEDVEAGSEIDLKKLKALKNKISQTRELS